MSYVKRRITLILFTVSLTLGTAAPAFAIRPFQIADDADAEAPGRWELEYGFVFERIRTGDTREMIIECP